MGWGSGRWLRILHTAGGGWQDQVGGLVPGIKIGRSEARLPLRVEVEEILVPEGFARILSNHLLLVYTGKTRLARNLLQVTHGLWPPAPPQCMFPWGKAAPPRWELALKPAGW